MKNLKRENMAWGERAKSTYLFALYVVMFLALAWCIVGIGAGQVFAAISDTDPQYVPILASPADGASTNNSRPTFDWSDITDPSGITYRIQIDNNSNFSSPERDENNISNSNWTMDWDLSDNTYYWRVKAIDGLGNESAWSSTWSFTVDTNQPSTPSMVSPSGYTNDTTPTFDWDDVTDTSGVTYSLQVDDDSNFASPILSKTGLTSSDYTATSGEALSEDTYYWQVRAVDGAGNQSAWSGSWSFVVDITAPAPPSLSSPTDGSLTNTRYPNLNWSYISDPSGVTYKLQVDDNADFSSPKLDKSNISGTGYTVTTPLDETTYYWRVKAVDGAGNESAWSSEWSFTVDVTQPSVPTLASPTDSTLTNNRRPTFDWSDVTDISGVSYRIQIDNNSNFSSPERDENNISNSTWTMDWDLSDNTYYWRVKAVDDAGNESAWTGAWSFVLDASNPSTPSMVSPSGNINDTTPTFDWDDVTDTSGVTYSLQVDDDWNFSNPDVTQTGLTSSEYTLTSGEALTEGNWYWRVKAIDGAGNDSGWAGYWSFTVDTTPPAPTTLSSPGDGGFTNTQYPNLNWSNISDPSGVSYKLQVDNNADFSSPELDKSSLSGTGYTVPTPLAETTYYWRVKAVDGAGNESAWSSEWSFTVDVTQPSVPTLVSPTDGALTNDRRPTFDWSDVTDPSGVSYRIQIDNSSNFSSPERDENNISNSTWTMDWDLSDNTYYWRVKAVDGAGNESAWTGAWSFDLDANSPSQPNLMTPNDWTKTNDTTPSFDWSDVTDTSGVSYSIQIDDDSYFSSPVLLTQQGLASSDYTLSTGEALAEGTYYWRVKAIDGAGNDSGWSYSWTFTVDTSAPGVPNLTSPSDGTAENSPTPSFNWSDVNDPSGVTYNLEIASDSNFSSVVLSKQGLNNSDYGLGGGESLTDGTYYWRVKAIDEAGNSGNWSNSWSLTVDTTAPSVPTLASPSDGALTNNNRPSFDWSDVSDASGVSYRIQISRYANFATTERDESWLGSSDYTSSWDIGDGTYYWRVQAVDGANNEGNWSSAWSLTIDSSSPPQPNLMTPNDWTYTNDTTPSFDWSDVTDNSGVSYSIEIDDDSYFSSPVLLTQQGLASSDYTLDTSEALTDGTYYWRVKAVDGAGNDSGWQQWAFTVDTTAPAVPYLTSPSDGEVRNDFGLNFDWSDVGDTSGVTYNLEIADDSGFTNMVLSEQGLHNSDHGLGGWGVLTDGTYYWRVQAVDEAGNDSGWSNSWTFTIDTTAPSVPSLVSPANGTSIEDPFDLSFDWSDVSDPSGINYNFQIAWDSNFFNMQREERWLGDSSYAMGQGMPDGTFYWRVQAVDAANNEGGWSDSWSFTVKTQDDGGGLMPSDGDKGYYPGGGGSGDDGQSGGPPLPVIGGGVLLVIGSTLGYLMIKRRRRTVALRKEFQGKLERWESKGYDVSAMKDKLFG